MVLSVFTNIFKAKEALLPFLTRMIGFIRLEFKDILAKESIKQNIFSSDHMNSFIYHIGHRDNQDFNTDIYIGLHKRPFTAILSLTCFFSRSYYCDKCNYAYNELTRHICQYTCKNCLKTT